MVDDSISLGPELAAATGVDPRSSIKFDDRGSLHNTYYDANGKRVYDCKFGIEDDDSDKPVTESSSGIAEIEELHSSNSTRTIVFIVILVILLAIVGFTFGIITKLGGM